MDAMGQKNNAMTEYGHVTNKYANQEEYCFLVIIVLNCINFAGYQNLGNTNKNCRDLLETKRKNWKKPCPK